LRNAKYKYNDLHPPNEKEGFIMMKYRLSVGEMLANPHSKEKKGEPPAYRISCIHLTDILENVDEVRDTANMLVDISPLLFGFELEPRTNIHDVLRDIFKIRGSCINNLAHRNGAKLNDVLWLEFIGEPEFYGFKDTNGKCREYSRVQTLHKSRFFNVYRNLISIDELQHRYDTECRFTLMGNDPALPDLLFYKQEPTIYEK